MRKISRNKGVKTKEIDSKRDIEQGRYIQRGIYIDIQRQKRFIYYRFRIREEDR